MRCRQYSHWLHNNNGSNYSDHIGCQHNIHGSNYSNHTGCQHNNRKHSVRGKVSGLVPRRNP